MIPVEAYTRGVGAGRTISKRTPHSLDREDHQDFVIRCRTYSNSKISDRESVLIYRFDPRSLIELLIQWAFSILCLEEDSNLHALEHEILSLACLPFHHQGILKVNRIPWRWYLSSVMYGIYDKGGVLEWSISSDRSCHIGPNRTSNCFDLNYPEDALYIIYINIISKRWTIKPISRFNRSPKRWIGSQITRDM